MEQLENYKKEKLTINLVSANIFGVLLIIPIVLFYGLPYYFIWGNEITRDGFKNLVPNISPEMIGISTILFFLIFISGIILHELIHGLTWAKYTRNGMKAMKFGVLWQMLTPYCHCKEPLKVKHYILGAITPAIFLGLGPAILSIITGNLGLLVFGMFFTMAAGGDFLIINLLRKEPMDNLVQDHPSEAGCYIYRK
jgi:uncharacterized membrane protein